MSGVYHATYNKIVALAIEINKNLRFDCTHWVDPTAFAWHLFFAF